MKPGATLADASDAKKIKMRLERLDYYNHEMRRIQDCIRIIEGELVELNK